MTHPALAHQILNTVFVTAERLGATVPKAISTEHQRLLKASRLSRDMFHRLSADLAGAVVAALENERDPLTDAAVQEAHTARGILSVQRGVEDAIATRTTELLIEHGGALITTFREPFDRAATAINAARDVLGDVDIDDMHAVLARGGNAAQLWAEAKKAGDTIAAIRQTWKLLSAAAPQLNVDPRYRIFVIADIPAGTFVDDQLGHINLSAWEAARRGFTLSLASPEELAQRTAAVHSELQRRQAEAEGTYKTAIQRRFGIETAA